MCKEFCPVAQVLILYYASVNCTSRRIQYETSPAVHRLRDSLRFFEQEVLYNILIEFVYNHETGYVN